MTADLPDRTEIERVASAAIRAIVARDSAALIALLPPDARADAEVDLAPGGGAQAIFYDDTAWRHQAAATWAGSFGEARVRRKKDGMRVRVVVGAYQDATVSVELAEHDGHWYFKDLRKRDVSSWGEPLA